MVLGLPRHDLAVVDDRDAVLGRVLGNPGRVDDVWHLVEVADHRDEVTTPLVLESPGQHLDRGL